MGCDEPERGHVFRAEAGLLSGWSERMQGEALGSCGPFLGRTQALTALSSLAAPRCLLRASIGQLSSQTCQDVVVSIWSGKNSMVGEAEWV